MNKPSVLLRWQADFLTGLAILLPGIISVALLVWFFGTVANFTDTLLFFLPRRWTHHLAGAGAVFWYWSLAALLLAVVLTMLVGYLARYYLGKKLIQMVEGLLLRVPLMNKIYGTVKQVNQAFSSSSKSSFKQVVLVEFPRAGCRSLGFITGDFPNLPGAAGAEHLVSVFIPTTPNPTSGFLILMPESAITRLDLPVAEGIKFIISLGSITPELSHAHVRARTAAAPAEPPPA